MGSRQDVRAGEVATTTLNDGYFHLRHAAGDAESGRRRYLLLVGGDLEHSAALTVLLETEVWVDTVSTASAALHRLYVSSPDLVILHLALSGLDGLHFLRTLRTRLPTCPVIVITASEQAESLGEISALGIKGFFRTPFQVDRLLEQIHALFAVQTQLPLAILPLNRYVSKAIEYMHRHYGQPLTVQIVADAIDVSSSHLAHLFRVAIAMTVREYLTKIRIEISKRLLTSTDSTLDSIAASVGFCDASHLSRVFRHTVGCWPGEYRRQLRGYLQS